MCFYLLNDIKLLKYLECMKNIFFGGRGDIITAISHHLFNSKGELKVRNLL